MSDETDASEISEERAAIEAIFGAESVVGGLRRFSFQLNAIDGSSLPRLALRFELPQGYPSRVPCAVRCGFASASALHNVRDDRIAESVERVATARAAELTGGPSVFDVVSAANDWLAENAVAAAAAASKEESSSDSDEDDEEKTSALLCVPKALQWWANDESSASDEIIREAQEAAARTLHEQQLRMAAGKESAPLLLPATDAARRRKRRHGGGAFAEWAPFVIGLIGKPSSGKSTLYNAACGLLSGVSGGAAASLEPSKPARMAAHPFTTIAPNTGTAFASVPCPCATLGIRSTCIAPFGHSASGERLVPIVLKDVAGLVPGAYQGRGRGNRFLDDLTDADALVHVVDVSGETDAEGRADIAYDPAADVGWVGAELHRWVFDNVRAKWPAVRRRPEKLMSMFSGYHADRSLIRLALRLAGVDPTTFSMAQQDAPPLPLAEWGPKHLHRVVAHFLRTRFPILVALNKADAPSAVANSLVQHVRDAWPLEHTIPVSARGELLLQQLRVRGAVRYEQAGASFEITENLSPAVLIQASFAAGFRTSDDEAKPVSSSDEVSEALRLLRENVLQQYGSSGVLAALSGAMSLRRPVAAFPVSDLSTFASVPAFDGPQKPFGPLRDCVLLRPGSTVGDLCEAMKHSPWLLVGGDFVHAEAFWPSAAPGKPTRRTVLKDDRITSDISILSIATTRRAAL